MEGFPQKIKTVKVTGGKDMRWKGRKERTGVKYRRRKREKHSMEEEGKWS